MNPKDFFKKNSIDSNNLKSKLAENQGKIHSTLPTNDTLNEDNIDEQEQKKLQKQQQVEDVAAKAGGAAITAATGIPKPIAEGLTKMAIKAAKNHWTCKLLRFFGVKPSISNNPIKSKIVVYGITSFLGISIVALFIFAAINGRVGSQRANVSNYLATGTVEDDEGEYKTSLGKYLKQEGWCKGGLDCFTSDAYKFYSTFRKKIISTQTNYNKTNYDNGCNKYGFSNIELDTALLLATITHDRADDELLKAPKNKPYSSVFDKYEQEMTNLTDAMIGKEEFYIDKTGEIINPKNFKEEKICVKNGFIWDKENNFCTALNSKVTKKTCYKVSELNYMNYIIGSNDYYNIGGIKVDNDIVQKEDVEVGKKETETQTQLEFIKSVGEITKDEQNISGIHASVTIAQAITESSWGKSGLSQKYNNYFGMKAMCKNPSSGCKGNEYWSGKTTYMCNKKGNDCAWYRVYDSLEDSIYDHGRNMWKTSVYGSKGVLEPGISNLEQLNRIAKAGYASANNYYNLIAKHMSYEVTKYDQSYNWNGEKPKYVTSGQNEYVDKFDIAKSFSNYLFVGDNYIDKLEKYGNKNNYKFSTIQQANQTSIDLLNAINSTKKYSNIENIVISIGANDIVQDRIGGKNLGVMDSNGNVVNAGKIREIVTTLKSIYPDAKIYVQTIFPIKKEHLMFSDSNANYSRLTKENINKYNTMMQNQLNGLDVNIIDATNNFVDEQGYLKSEMADSTPSTGIKIDKYKTWLQNTFNAISTVADKNSVSTKGGYIETYRSELIKDIYNKYEEKIYIYKKISEEAESYGSFITNGDYIYGEDIPIVDETKGEYSNWKQFTASWAGIKLGSSNKNMKRIGCLTTSVAIQIKRSNTTTNLPNFNPGTFVQAINKNNGYTADGNLIWTSSEKIAPNFKYKGKIFFTTNSTKQDRILEIKKQLQQGNKYVIMCVKNCGHWVAVTSVSNEQIYILDPGRSDTVSTFPIYKSNEIKQIAIYEKTD